MSYNLTRIEFIDECLEEILRGGSVTMSPGFERFVRLATSNRAGNSQQRRKSKRCLERKKQRILGALAKPLASQEKT